MIQEISTGNQFTVYNDSFSEFARDDSGENVKEAFLSLLQGLVGMMPQSADALTNIDAPRQAIIRSAEESVKEKTNQSFEKSTSDQAKASKDDNQQTKNETSSKLVETQKSEKTDAPKSNSVEVNNVVEQDQNNIQEKAQPQAESLVSKPIKDIVTQIKEVAQDLNQKLERSSEQQNQSPESLPVQEIVRDNSAQTQVAEYNNSNKNLSQDKLSQTLESSVKEKLDGSKSSLNQTLVANDDSGDEISKVIFDLLANTNHITSNNSVPSSGANPQLNSMQLSGALRVNDGNASLNSLLNLKSDVDLNLLSAKGLKENSASQARFQKVMEGAESKQKSYVDKVKEVLERAAMTKTTDSVRVKINPEHLGEIVVKISQKNGEIFARLTPDSKEVEQTLRTKSHELVGVLQNLGFKPEDVHVSIGSEQSEFGMFSGGTSNKESGSKGSQSGSRGVFNGRNEVGIEATLNSFPKNSAGVEESGWVA